MDEGQEHEDEEREEERRKKTAAAKETERTSTGTLTNIPFCIVGEEEEERNAIDDENRERGERSLVKETSGRFCCHCDYLL